MNAMYLVPESEVERDAICRRIVRCDSLVRQSAQRFCDLVLHERRKAFGAVEHCPWQFWVAVGRIQAAAELLADGVELRRLVVAQASELARLTTDNYEEEICEARRAMQQAAADHAKAYLDLAQAQRY